MNLLFLVEGGKTEPQVYKAWIKHYFPDFDYVVRPEDMSHKTFRIIPGNGYPNMVSTPRNYAGVSRLEACLLDIKDYGNIDHFFICLDSEEETYESRINELLTKLHEGIAKVDLSNNPTKYHVIVQKCCIETWALGNSNLGKVIEIGNVSPKLKTFIEYYDIALQCPESMECCPPGHPFPRKARFHFSFLKEYLNFFGLKYSKSNPSCIADPRYFDDLVSRSTSTGHLPSLRIMLDVWDSIILSLES